MGLSQIRIISFTFVCLLFVITIGKAQDTEDKRHIEVSLRMIGHQVLLSSGDSTSRVLPIIRENDQYRVQFESEFEFTPEDLVNTVNRVVKESKMAKSYIVEVENCETKEIVYSYEVNDLQQTDIIPCKGRVQPKTCYSLLFTLAEIKVVNYNLIISLLVLLGGGLFLLWKSKNKPMINPNIIPLGEYHFDKRNSELLVEGQRIELTSKESDLLILLYNAVNTTIEREVILKRVWGDEGDYVGRTLDVFISKLRKKLEADPKVKIVNIRGVGYKLVMDV